MKFVHKMNVCSQNECKGRSVGGILSMFLQQVQAHVAPLTKEVNGVEQAVAWSVVQALVCNHLKHISSPAAQDDTVDQTEWTGAQQVHRSGGVQETHDNHIHVHGKKSKPDSYVNVRDTVRNYSIGTFSWGSPIVWGLPYSLNRHVTPVSVWDRKGITYSIQAPPSPRFDTLRQSVSNRAQLFLAV